jgi:putative ABC transport system ATP-binding protein
MSPAPFPAFRIEGLGHRYPGAAGHSLEGISADMPAGETIAVLGPSGSGKSTLLSLMGLLWDGPGSEGRLRYHDGSQEYDFLDRTGARTLSGAEKAALRASSFGFVLQSSYMLPHFTSLENLGMPLAMQGWPAGDRARWASALMEAVRANGGTPEDAEVDDLHEKRHEPPRKASFGQRQRYAVLRALVADPTVVFADEPSSSLDPGRAARLFALLDRWKSGELFGDLRRRFAESEKTSGVVRRWLERTGDPRPPRTLILVCHDVATARREADRFLLLTQEHTLEAYFHRSEWNDNAEAVERVLRLHGGEAGRDGA